MLPWLLLIIALAAAIHARNERGRTRAARELLGLMAIDQDSMTDRLYSVDGVVGRLIPELQWAALTNRSVSIVVTRWFMSSEQVGHCATAIAGLLRAHECVFRTDQQELAVAIAAADELQVLHAVRRIISSTVQQLGPTICDVGSATFPADATHIDGLFDVARARMRPWQDWVDAAEQIPWIEAASS